jgi:pyridoxamine--pyruvate transaminase
MSLVALSPQAWAAIERNPQASRDSFLSLLDYRDKWHGKGRFPYTPSVSELYGVDVAADLVLAEGLDAVQARHARVASACRAGVKGMGLALWAASEAIAADCATAIRVPDGLTDIVVRDHVRARYNVQLSGGQSAGNLVRIGHMGNNARGMYTVAGLAALGQGLRDLGVSVNVGAGVEAAMAVLSATMPGARPAVAVGVATAVGAAS